MERQDGPYHFVIIMLGVLLYSIKSMPASEILYKPKKYNDEKNVFEVLEVMQGPQGIYLRSINKWKHQKYFQGL